jgi:hypothetical protein
MKSVRFLLSKTGVTVALVIGSLILFNVFIGKVDTEKLAAFNDWYPPIATILSEEEPPPASSLRVTIQLSGSFARGGTTSQTFPTQSLADQRDREQTFRVLQLLSESKVFGLPAVTRPHEGGSYVTITVSDERASFQTIVNADTVEKSIQLKNLLKLLELYAATPRKS